MSVRLSRTPAFFWRAFLLCGLFAAAARGAAPAGPRPELAQVGKPDAREAARLVEEFRAAGLPGEYYLEFQVRQLPRRGAAGTALKGRWWGSRTAEGPVLRIELTDAAGVPHRILLENGPEARAWRLHEGRPVKLDVAGLMAPLVPGIEIAAFDLQMPFLYWPNPTVDRIARSDFGRPSYRFVFPAPPDFQAQFAGIGAARAYLDTQYNVPTQTEVLAPDGRLLKSLALLSLQNVKGQALPKSVDYRNELSRDKTRLLVTAAALNLDLPPGLFRPEGLGQAGAVPDPAGIVRFEP